MVQSRLDVDCVSKLTLPFFILRPPHGICILEFRGVYAQILSGRLQHKLDRLTQALLTLFEQQFSSPCRIIHQSNLPRDSDVECCRVALYVAVRTT